MTDVVHCSPNELGAVLLDDFAEHIEDQRRMLVRGLAHIQQEMVAQAPRYAGDFAASIQPYAGVPGETWQRGGGGHDAGAAEVEAVLETWEPGQDLGIATDAPYSRKLIFHAGEDRGRDIKRVRVAGRKRIRRVITRRTYTKSVGAGWVDRIVLDANRLMEQR